MTAKILDGKLFSARIRNSVAEEVNRLKRAHGTVPGLAVVLVGKDPASEVYVRNKARQTEQVGMASFKYEMEEGISEAELVDFIESLNGREDVHGILVQLPLPRHIDSSSVISTILPGKDVDGFHISNVGLLVTGQRSLVPCTPLGCLMMLRASLGNLAGLNAVIIGRSNIVGKPMANLLLRESCTVTIAHSKTRDLPAVCRNADILVAAVGRPQFVNANFVKPGATIIDVGINRIPAPERGKGKTRLIGDVDFVQASQVAGAITPVPGGVGPMTIACLLANTLTACCRAYRYPEPELLLA